MRCPCPVNGEAAANCSCSSSGQPQPPGTQARLGWWWSSTTSLRPPMAAPSSSSHRYRRSKWSRTGRKKPSEPSSMGGPRRGLELAGLTCDIVGGGGRRLWTLECWCQFATGVETWSPPYFLLVVPAARVAHGDPKLFESLFMVPINRSFSLRRLRLQ